MMEFFKLRLRQKWTRWLWRLNVSLPFFIILIKGIRFDSEGIGLMIGAALLFGLIVVAFLIGKARFVEVSDHIVIKRYLAPDHYVGFDQTLFFDDDALLLGRCAIELDEFSNTPELLVYLANNPRVTLSLLKPEDTKRVALVGWNRIRQVIPFVVCFVYGVFSITLQIRLLAGSWDFVVVPLIVFALWYPLNWWLDKRAIENPMA